MKNAANNWKRPAKGGPILMLKISLIFSLFFTSCSQDLKDIEIEEIAVRYCQYVHNKDKDICPRSEKKDRKNHGN